MISVKLHSHKNYDSQRLETLKRAFVIIERVLNSEKFKQEVLNYTTAGKKTFSYKRTLFREFEHYTNEEVYKTIMQADEETGNILTGHIDLYLELVIGGGGVGYGYPGDKTIYTYSEWFDEQSDESIANHITHEWCYKIGFDHAFYDWQDKNRERSVPYGIGNLVEELA